jgi:hypothetical protein
MLVMGVDPAVCDYPSPYDRTGAGVTFSERNHEFIGRVCGIRGRKARVL